MANKLRFPIGHHRVARMVECSVRDNRWELDDNGWYLYKNFADFFYSTRARCHSREPRCDDCPFELEREV